MKTSNMLLALLLALFGFACTSPSVYTGVPRQQFDGHTQYSILDQTNGYLVITYVSRYQFIPESDVVAESAKHAAIRIAKLHSSELGKKIKPVGGSDAVISTGRNGFTGITSASATVMAEFAEAGE